jgi:hypothetical protein
LSRLPKMNPAFAAAVPAEPAEGDGATTTRPPRDNVGTVGDLHASATRLTGLTDFGDDDYLDGLMVLLASYERDEKLTPLGRKMSRVFLREAMAARLLSEAAWQRYPEHAEVSITQPIFVTGLPRTGTTALHRLLTADPAHQGLELWLTQAPQPRPPRAQWASDPVFVAMQAAYQRHQVEHPEFMGLHHLAADQVEECWRLLSQSIRSVSFECLAHVPTYSSWLQVRGWRDAYRRHKRNLQLIGLNDADRRWVLKNPSHLFALHELLAVYPDALVIQTHRRPRVAIASACSLSAHATAGWSERFVGPVIGADQLDLWARGLEEFLEARKRYDKSRFCDVWYEDFVDDPLGTVESIYEHFGIELTGTAVAAMRAAQAERAAAGARHSHKYSLSDFGLTGEQVDARFSGYLGMRG